MFTLRWWRLVVALVWVAGLTSVRPAGAQAPEPGHDARSPDGRLKATVFLGNSGEPVLDLSSANRALIGVKLGLDLAGSGPLETGLRRVGVRQSSVDTTYTIPVGKTASARDQHNELIVLWEEVLAPHRRLELAVRVFDDGFAFRYQIPAGGPLANGIIRDELTRFTFVGTPRALALPLKDYTTSYEGYYKTLDVTAMAPDQLYALPMLLDQPAATGSGRVWMAITEANLTNYAGMYLARGDGKPGTLAAKLSPLPGRIDGARVVVDRVPFETPWRVVMVADDPGRLIESNLIFHLNAPSAIADPSWIKPGKTLFPWWNGYVDEDVTFKPGVNTATMKHYIDFAAAHGIPYHSLDGLDIAWYGGPIQPQGPTDITRAAPSIDMPELLAYAKSKNIRLRVWLHWKALKAQIDEAFRVYGAWGLEGVMVDFMDRDDQEMVRFYHEMARKAAEHHLTVTLHGAYKPTGLERTWPNVLTYEAALNQEYNKWEKPGEPGTPPRHNLDIAFVRMLAGPLDYHQGGMRSVLPENYHPRDKAPPVQGTRGHQLAMYVVYQNHLPMMADYPEAYRNQAGLDFMVDVPTTWDETRVLHAELGECLVIARRKGDVWYLGGMTAGAGRDLDLTLPGPAGKSSRAELRLDDPAHGPTALIRRQQVVPPTGRLAVTMPRAGGFVARITPVAAGN